MLSSSIATYVVCADGGANRLREFGQREHTKSAKKGRPRAKAKISRSVSLSLTLEA